VAVAPHYRTHEETWPGGFFRKPEDDRKALEGNPVPGNSIGLKDFQVAGHSVTYQGCHAVAWRAGAQGRLVAFAGNDCTGIDLDGQSYRWANQPVDIAWHPLQAGRQAAGYTALYRVWVSGDGQVCLPLGLEPAHGLEVWLGAHMPAWRGRKRSAPAQHHALVGYGLRRLPFTMQDGSLVLEVDEAIAEHWLYVVRPV
jgi:hypothetical protein